jgi:hypothetical protein
MVTTIEMPNIVSQSNKIISLPKWHQLAERFTVTGKQLRKTTNNGD